MSGLLATLVADVDASSDATPTRTPSEKTWADESSVVSSQILDVPGSTIRSSSGQRSVLDSATTVSDAPSRNEKDGNISAAVSPEVEQTSTRRRGRGNNRINAGGRGRRGVFRSRDTPISPKDVEIDVNQQSEDTTPSVVDNLIFTRTRRARNRLNQAHQRPFQIPKTPPLDPTLIEDDETSKIGLIYNEDLGPGLVPQRMAPLPRGQTFIDVELDRRRAKMAKDPYSYSSEEDLPRRSRPKPRVVEYRSDARGGVLQYERPEREYSRRRSPVRRSQPTLLNSQYLANSLQGARPGIGTGSAGISSTISKDNTHGDGARNAKLLAEFARKNQRTGLGRGFRGNPPEKAAAADRPLVDDNSEDDIDITIARDRPRPGYAQSTYSRSPSPPIRRRSIEREEVRNQSSIYAPSRSERATIRPRSPSPERYVAPRIPFPPSSRPRYNEREREPYHVENERSPSPRIEERVVEREVVYETRRPVVYERDERVYSYANAPPPPPPPARASSYYEDEEDLAIRIAHRPAYDQEQEFRRPLKRYGESRGPVY